MPQKVLVESFKMLCGNFMKNKIDCYPDVDISILIPVGSLDNFPNVVESVIKTCSNLNRIEIIVKLDSDQWLSSCQNLFSENSIQFKILSFPQGLGYNALHVVQNKMAAIASGDTLWMLNDRDPIVIGDWVSVFDGVRGLFVDNLYVLHTGSPLGDRPKHMPFPAVSKEWYELFGCISPVPASDAWLSTLSKSIGRYVDNEQTNSIKLHHSTGRSSNMPRSFYDCIKKDINEMLPQYRQRWENTIVNHPDIGSLE